MTKFAKLMFGAASMVALFSTAAMADADYAGFSGYVTGVSDYRFRGISNSDRHPTAQGSINWEGEDGWYVGTWASGVDFDDPDVGGTNVELDIYGGKHIDLGDGTDLNLEAYGYLYPDAASGLHYDYFEGIVGLTHDFDGKLSLGATAAWSPEFFGKTGDAFWVGGNATVPLNDWLSVSGNVGHQWINLGTDYTHWDLGGTITWGAFAIDARYVDTDIHGCGGTSWCDAGALVSLTYNIPG
jgi:uncharacterized protein (TIGR02001 family)